MKPKRVVKLMRTKYYSNWEPTWFENRMKGREQSFALVGSLCQGCQSVLDIGGGIGLLKRYLSPDVMKYDVVDRSPRAREWGEELWKDVKFTTGTIDDIIDSYDAVVGMQVLEHAEYYDHILRSAWQRANKIMVFSFFGLGDIEQITRYHGYGDYWNNKYSYSRLMKWLRAELNPLQVEVHRVNVDRDYSPERVIVLYKDGGNGKS